MAKIYRIKTTAVNNFFGFPELFLYINQELFDTYVDQPTGTIFEETYTGIPNNKIINEVLKDDASVYRLRKIYYNNYIEQQYGNLAPLTDIFEILGKVIYKYDANTYKTNLLYNNLNYGELSCFTPTLPTGTTTVNDTMIMGGQQSGEVPYFGGYYIYAGISPRSSLAFINIPVFSEDILNEDDEIVIQGKYILMQIYCRDLLPDYGTFDLSIRFVAQGDVSTLTNASMFSGTTVEEDTNNPYSEGGTSDTGGGEGTFDPSGDTIGVPSLPTLSAIDTGFVSIWEPTKTQLKNLYNYLWSGLDLNTFKKIFANPIDTIMGFSIIPLTPTTGNTKELKVGNIGTGIQVTPVTEQYYEIDCGTITIPEFFGSYLDYEPYTTIDLYLPYIGSVRISTDDIKRNPPNNGTIQLIYHIDILSGSCVVFVVTNGTVSYQYNGSILTQLPITGNDFTSTINSVLGLTSNIVGGVMSASTGNAAGVLGNSVNAAHNVTSAKPSINRSGNISGSGGFLGIQKPFLIMNLPKQAIAFAQNTFTGYPAHITNSVKSLSGYTEFEQIWIEKVPATENELSEIESILTSGVIL